MVDLDTPLDEEFLDAAVGQVVAQVQPDRDHDDIRREPEPGERRPVRRDQLAAWRLQYMTEAFGTVQADNPLTAVHRILEQILAASDDLA
ncbi:hypothetical protein ACFY37_41135, partial [Dactylosporangium aurantiacum]